MTNKIFAAIVFLFCLIIYISTMAPTTSFWDCGEFIACSYTLGVPHPPGTPLYLLIGNVFSNSLFFIDDIGARVNLISPIVSALSVMFLYLIIVQLINKWFQYKNNKINSLSVYLSAAIGSLTFAFTDSQWFNAVEAEVYGMSTFFTAIVVWLVLKWTENRGKNGNIKYIIIISYLVGLAIGVHLLNLLAIPFIALIIYFNITKDNLGGFLIDNSLTYILGLISFIGFDILGFNTVGSFILTILIIALSLLIRYAITLAIWKEYDKIPTYLLNYLKRISVLIISGIIFIIINSGIIKGIPNMLNFFNSDGSSILMNFLLPLFLFLALIIGLILFSILKNKIFRVSVISLLMIYIGFSTYIMIPIRANDNPNINENSPDSWEHFLSYMNRDQYGAFDNIDWKNILKYYLSSNQVDKEKDESSDNMIDKKIEINPSRLLESVNKQRWVPFPVSGLSNDDIKKRLLNEDVLNFIMDYQIKEMYLRYFGWQFIGKDYNKEEFSWNRNISEIYQDLPLKNNQWDSSIQEPFIDTNKDGKWNIGEEFTDSDNNGRWYEGEPFTDTNKNGVWNSGEPFNDLNQNKFYDSPEPFIDIGDGQWNKGEQFIDINQNGRWDSRVSEPFLDMNENGRWENHESFTDLDGRNYSWDISEPFTDINKNNIHDNNIEVADSISDVNWTRYGLPFALIFAIIGLIYHFIRDPKRAFSILILFIITGIAIILYLNQYDPQPRERDYSYVGSFFAFSVWIGIGCMALFDLILYLFSSLKDKQISKISILTSMVLCSLTLLGVMPLNHLINDYQYHNRTGNNAAWDYGYNLLNSCDKDAILFTNGDNDTFPLWYIQEVPKIRTDVRVVNLSLLNTPWYIKQIYNNNAPGNIKFNFDEPILTQDRVVALNKKLNNLKVEDYSFIGTIPILKNNENQYYIDLNNNKVYDQYNDEKTLEIIKNLEDAVTGTIYAYKRWDPISWALIEHEYFMLEFGTAINNLYVDCSAFFDEQSCSISDNFGACFWDNKESVCYDSPDILKTIYDDNYHTVRYGFETQAKNYISQNFDEELENHIKNKQISEYTSLLYQLQNVIASLYLTDIKNKIDKNNETLSDYLNNFIDKKPGMKGNGVYAALDNKDKKVTWGKTPDQSGENYVFPITASNGNFQPLTAQLNYKSNPVNIKQYPTLQGYFFKIQDIMILKIMEDIDSDRDIYFATTVNPHSRMNLDLYLSNQGMVLEVMNESQTTELDLTYSGLYLDREKLQENLFNVYRFTNLNNSEIYYNSDLQRILQNYRMLFLYLAEGYENDKNMEEEVRALEMKSVMEYMNLVMPDSIIKIQNPNLKLYAGQKYYNAGMDKDYNRLLKELNNLDSYLEMATFLSQYNDFIESNRLIQIILNTYSLGLNDREQANLKEFLESIDLHIQNNVANSNYKNLEDIIYNTVITKLAEHEIDLYESDDILLTCLQVLIKNYRTQYLNLSYE